MSMFLPSLTVFDLLAKIRLRFLWTWNPSGGSPMIFAMCFSWSAGSPVGRWGKTSVASSLGDLKPCHALHSPDPALVLVDVLLSEGLAIKELLDVLVEDRRLLADPLVHQGLTYNVDYDILLELSTPVSSKLAHEIERFNIVTVYVKDRRIDEFGNVRTVGCRTGKTWISSETNLVVDDQMDRAASVVCRKCIEAHGLVYDTLGSESSVTVEKHSHGGSGMSLIVVVVEDGAGLAEHDRIFGFQVRWVGNQRELHTLTGRCWTFEVHTQMVLDISRSLISSICRTTEFGKDRLIRLADDIGKHIETTSVRHSNNNVLDTVVDRAIDESLHTGDERFTTFQTKPLVVGVLGGQETFKRRGPNEPVQDSTLLVD
ncbi:hypothetical protein AC579_7602 [Pseudocercospora musae]|uniref:Uncharacterized protein n=1 Tax=Pseudocercospora musae TaxID=113226 RepID=A0A139IDP3_9PEZI|nr:hypothetical protein AC579_7602 [Pseudocercospora musae]